MARQIGSFSMPEIKEKCWFEPDTVYLIEIDPASVFRFKATEAVKVSYQLSNAKEDQTILLKAECSIHFTTFSSDPIRMQEIEFATELANHIDVLDESPLIKQAKALALCNLQSKALHAGYILGNLQLDIGIGFIVVENNRVGTIEAIEIRPLLNGSAEIQINDCVCPAAISNLTNPSISFYTSNYLFEVDSFTVKSDSSGVIKTIVIETNDIKITQSDDMPHKACCKLDKNNEESVLEFIRLRTQMLSLTVTQNKSDETFANRLADIL